MPSYPAISPWKIIAEYPKDYGTIRTEMEQGYVQTRARTTVAPKIMEIEHHGLTSAQIDTWLAFWDSVTGGSATFTYTDPRTGNVLTCRFNDKKSPPKITSEPDAPSNFNITGITIEVAL